MKNNVFRSLLILGFVMLYGFTQAQSVSGTVSDANGPLPGATVLVKGTSNGTTTDFDGKYALKEVGADAILVISFVGYTSQEITVGGKATIDVTLVEDANQLQEVVVVGYTTQTRGDISGSVASVDMSEAVKTPMVNAAEALQGRVSGVTVTNSGAPGSAPKITIRGFGTSNNSNPLYIIDGVQTDDGNILNTINPADIEQMNVLKDGAAAIYGARASNGVVIITTKSGSYNMDKALVSVDMYTGFSQIIEKPEMLNLQQHGDMIWESLKNDGKVPSHDQYGTGATPVIPTSLVNMQRIVSYNPQVLAPASVSVRPGGTKWFDEVFQNAPTQNVSISLQNGTETGKYFMSASYLNRDGIQIHTGFKRGNTRLNSEFKLLKGKIRVGEHINASFINTKSGNQVNMTYRASPLMQVYDDDGNFSGSSQGDTGLSNSQNPVALLTRSKDDFGKSFQVMGDVYLEADLLDGLTVKTVFGGTVSNYHSRDFSALDPEHSEPVTVNKLIESENNGSSWTWTNTINYNKIFDEHSLNVLVGIEAAKFSNKGKRISNTDFLFETPSFYLLSNGAGDPIVERAYDGSNSLYSLFGTVNYSYASKYFVTATLRRDKSSRFVGDNQSDIFPSFSVGWALSKEDFFPQDALVNRMKLKASYGELGNQTLPGGILTENIFELNNELANYSFGGITTGALLTSTGNENLAWETSKSTNIGFDLGMFNNALTTSFEWYNKTTDGLVVQDRVRIPTTGSDGNAPFVNKGSVKNTGIDFSIGYQNRTKSGIGYNINANISTYKNEVTEWISDFEPGSSAGLRSGVVTRTEKGQPISYFFGRVVEGIFGSEAEVSGAADQGFTTPADGVGRFRYKDVNGDGKIDADDRTFMGSPHPDFTYGINLGADYKGFDIAAFFQGSQGNEIYNHEKLYVDFPKFFDGNRSTRVLDSWRPDNLGASLPALSKEITNGEVTSNSYFVEDGSYLRLKNLQIGYTFPEDISKKMSMESLRFYLQGTNLFTITGYDGLDPEVVQDQRNNNLTLGVDANTFPIAKVLTLGVNIKF